MSDGTTTGTDNTSTQPPADNPPADTKPTTENTPPADDVPARAESLQKTLGDLGERIGKLETKPATDKKPDRKLADRDAPPEWAVQLQRKAFADTVEALPEDVGKKLSKQLADGDLSVMAAIERAEMLAAYVPKPDGDPPLKGKPGSGARSDGQRFANWDQWTKFRTEREADAHKYMQSNPTFTPSKLPGGPRHGR